MHLHWSQMLLIIKERISLMLKPYLGCFSPLLPRFRDSINILFLCSSNLSDIIHRATSENYAHICYFKVLVCQQFLFILLFLYTNGHLDLSNRHFFSIATFARNMFFSQFFEVYRCFTFIVSLCTP